MIREFLKTPVYKDIIRDNLKAVSHTDGRSIVKAVMEEDPAVFLELVTTTPSLANALMGSLAELGERIAGQYPPGVLTSFIESMAGEIDVDCARRCGAAWKNVAGSLWDASPESRSNIMSLALTAGPKIMASGLNALANAVNSLERERPGTTSSFIASTFSNLDRHEVSMAMKSLSGAFLDQKWHFFSWLFGLAIDRIKKRLGLKEGNREL
jgi:hypothetical protein